ERALRENPGRRERESARLLSGPAPPLRGRRDSRYENHPRPLPPRRGKAIQRVQDAGTRRGEHERRPPRYKARLGGREGRSALVPTVGDVDRAPAERVDERRVGPADQPEGVLHPELRECLRETIHEPPWGLEAPAFAPELQRGFGGHARSRCVMRHLELLRSHPPVTLDASMILARHSVTFPQSEWPPTGAAHRVSRRHAATSLDGPPRASLSAFRR